MAALEKIKELIAKIEGTKEESKANDPYEFWEVYTHPFSKFYSCGKEIEIDGVGYRTIEHFYQSQKVLDPQLKQQIINAPTHEEAHLMGQCVDTVHDWFQINDHFYYKGQKAKFEQFPDLKQLLLDTGSQQICCLDSDAYWGCIGQNKSGKLLERIRNDLKLEMI